MHGATIKKKLPVVLFKIHTYAYISVGISHWHILCSHLSCFCKLAVGSSQCYVHCIV